MQRLEISGAVRPLYGSLGVKWLIIFNNVTVLSMLSTSNISTALCGSSTLRMYRASRNTEDEQKTVGSSSRRQ